MKIISWNLNGLMAAQKSGALDFIIESPPDIICFQEIRTRQEPVLLPGYFHYWHHGQVDGYSGTAVLTRVKPRNVTCGFLNDFEDEEGRIMTLDMGGWYMVNAYFPNPHKNLQRKAFRREFDQAMLEHAGALLEEKPVIICGDFNVAREPIDIFAENTKQNWAQLGYTSDERDDLETLIGIGLADAFRQLYPGRQSFTWWSNRLYKRREDRGWRLDLFLVASSLMPKVRDVQHLQERPGSDHCPILLEVSL